MKKKTYIFMFMMFMILGIIFYILKIKTTALILIGFSFMLVVTFTTNIIMEKRKIKKLDEKYFVLKKEQFLNEYEKLTKEFNNGKLKQIILTYIKFKKEPEPEDLKRFGLWLQKNYFADPSGIDEDILILFVNIHEILMPEIIKDIKQKIKEEDIKIEFDYGFTIYKTNDEYEDLKTRAFNNIKLKKE